MDFIERWFGISPDGGNGALEAVYVVAFAGGIALLVFRRRLFRLLSGAQSRERKP